MAGATRNDGVEANDFIIGTQIKSCIHFMHSFKVN